MINKLLAVSLLLASSPAFAGDWNTFVVKSQEEWKQVCARFPEIAAPDEPRADFSTDMLVLVVGAERSRAGHKVEIKLLQDPLDPARLTVFYRDIPPRRSSFGATVMTRAYGYYRVPRRYSTVTFEFNRRLEPAAGRVQGWLDGRAAF